MLFSKRICACGRNYTYLLIRELRLMLGNILHPYRVTAKILLTYFQLSLPDSML